MRYRSLTENRLSLNGGDVKSYAADYGAFLITMHPHDFLLLTTHDDNEYKQICDAPFPIPTADFEALGYEWGSTDKFQLPYLNVIYPSGQIIGHEGRHRAAMIMKQGGDKFPVAIFMRTPYAFELNYTIADCDHIKPDQKMVERFDNRAAAEARRAELDDADVEGDEDGTLYYSRFKIDTHHPIKLRGCPERSDPSEWRWAPWEISDFPKQLVGQFSPVTVPKSRFGIGLMKRRR